MLDNNYWNIDDILMSEEIVLVKLNMNCPFLSLLNTNQTSEVLSSLSEGESLQLPISLACPLAQLGAIDIENPSYLSDQYYNILKADPTISNLSGTNKYFYDKCNLLLPYVDAGSDNKWNKILIKTIFERFLNYFKNSQNVQMINTNIHKHCSNKESKFFLGMVKYNNNKKFFKENYSNNNKVLEDKIEAKKVRLKMKKSGL